VRARGELTPRQVERLRHVAKILDLEKPSQGLKSA
jgi:hypothetical protein